MDQDQLVTSSHNAAEQPLTDDKPALSKSAKKKIAKAERYAQYKIERRAREKDAKKEKKRLLAAKRAAGELDETEEEIARHKKKAKTMPLNFLGRVIVDLGFDNLMSEKEVVSLSSQLAYTYSANRRASYPFSLIFTSLDGKTFNRLESMSDAGYKRWSRTEWWQEGYDRLWSKESSVAIPQTAETAESDKSTQNSSEGSRQGSLLPSLPVINEDVKGSVVYLTADSEEELTELKENETYIIGGICDHNRYKNLCLNKAKESGVRTARLPIGRYLASLPTRKVLTVNQVFEILLKWVETRDWEEALYSVVPKRKFQSGKASNDTQAEGAGPRPEEQDEEEQEQDVAEYREIIISAEETKEGQKGTTIAMGMASSGAESIWVDVTEPTDPAVGTLG